MRATFIIGFLFGFGGLLAAAYFFPIAEHERIESLSSVAINGGRIEQFLVRLPADRIAVVGDTTSAPRANAYPAGLRVPSQFAEAGISAEHYKLRDAEGTVIGIATHHATMGPDGPAAIWLLDIPGRGTLVFAGEGRQQTSVASALRAAGYRSGTSWRGDLRTGPLLDAEQTRILSGTEEFEDVDGRYSESWQITGLSETGEIQGTIELATSVNRRS